jgi:hypothetical protein
MAPARKLLLRESETRRDSALNIGDENAMQHHSATSIPMTTFPCLTGSPN